MIFKTHLVLMSLSTKFTDFVSKILKSFFTDRLSGFEDFNKEENN